MNELDDVQQEYEEKLDKMLRQRGHGLSTGPRGACFEDRLGRLESIRRTQAETHRRRCEAVARNIWCAARLPVRRPALTQPPVRPPVQSRIELRGEETLRNVDTEISSLFEIAGRLPGDGLVAYPTVYCETLEEFLGPQIELLDLSTSARAQMLAQAVEKARQTAAQQKGGVWGVHIPGQGCYLNGWLFAYGRAENARAALLNPPILLHVLATIVHEKWGHGFISEYTALGREKKQLGTWRYELARRFGFQPADTPESALLADKEALLYTSSQFLEEGWATWIEHHLMPHLVREVAADDPSFEPGPWQEPRYSLEGLHNWLDRMQSEHQDGDVIESLRWALTVLFDEPSPAPEDLHRAIVGLHSMAAVVGPAFQEAFGQPARYVIGYLLMRKLEKRLGALCVPYAAVIAANVAYDLENVAAGDLRSLVSSNPRLNADVRLALLGLLEVPDGNVMELAHQAQESLSLTVPGALRA